MKSALSPRGQRWLIGLLTGLVTLTPMGIDIYLPSLPAMAQDFGRPVTALQASITLKYSAMSSFAVELSCSCQLTPNRPITPDDLVSAEGGCPGMPAPATPADANASTEAPAGAPQPAGGTVALGHAECDVVRGIGAPDNVNISNNERGERLAVVTWSHGPRAGIYTFTAGRLSSIEAVPAPATPPKAAKSKPRARKTG